MWLKKQNKTKHEVRKTTVALKPLTASFCSKWAFYSKGGIWATENRVLWLNAWDSYGPDSLGFYEYWLYPFLWASVYLHIEWGNMSTYFSELSRELNEVTCIKTVTQRLIHGKYWTEPRTTAWMSRKSTDSNLDGQNTAGVPESHLLLPSPTVFYHVPEYPGDTLYRTLQNLTKVDDLNSSGF